MSESLPTVESVRGELADLAQPLHAQLERIKEALDAKQQEVDDLRAVRAEIERALRAVDPSFMTERGRKVSEARRAKAAARNGHEPLDPDLLDLFREFIVTHRFDFPAGDITVKNVVKISAGQSVGLPRKKLSAGLAELRDQGVLRLDRKVRGGASIYKLTS